jgi:hypothetical protein
MSDLAYNPTTNVTPLSTREHWNTVRAAHKAFIEASDLGPIQRKKALMIYSTIHWEGGVRKSTDGIVTRILTADMDPERQAAVLVLIDNAWGSIGWALTKVTFKAWYASMNAAFEALKLTRKPEPVKA